MKTKTAVSTLRLEQDFYEKLKLQAKEKGISVAELTRLALAKYLKSK